MKPTDAEEVFQQLGISYITEGNHHCSQGWIQINCPLCSEPASNTWHLGFNLAGGFFNCWRCGPHSTYEILLAYNIEPKVAYPIAKGLRGGLKQYMPTQTEQKRLVLPDGLTGSLRGPYEKYLTSRGWDPERLQQLWRLDGLGRQAGKLAWRIFIPIYLGGRVMSWTTRSLNPTASLRYITAKPEQERLPSKDLVYGLDYCTHTIVIAEGPTDVWTGGPGCVATFGTGVTQEQINKLIKYPIRYVCFDNSKEAQKRALQLCDTLSLFSGQTYNIQLDSEDLGSATRKEVKQIRKLLE